MTTLTSAPPSFFTSAEPEDIYLKRMVTTPCKMVTSSWPHPYKEELNLCHTLTYMDLISMKTTNYKLHLFLNTTCKASFFSRCNSSRLHPLVNKQQVIRLKSVSFMWQNCAWLSIWRAYPLSLEESWGILKGNVFGRFPEKCISMYFSNQGINF